MRLNKKVFIVMLIFSFLTNVYAHSGRTDSNGGHKDKNNVSGLGYYHYHCGGNPAHLHENGVCPYSTSSVSSNSVNNKITSEEKEVENIEITKIIINESIQSMKVGQEKQLTISITPSDATNKNVKWISSNSSIISVNDKGKILANSAGIATIEVIAENEVSTSIKIKVEDNITEKSENLNESTTNNVSSTNSDSNDSFAETILGAAVVGGGSYLGYKKYKNKK